MIGLIGGLCLMMLFITPIQATQYDPPWAHNYDFLYDDDLDSRPTASYASNIQSIVGYDNYSATNSDAEIAYLRMKDDSVFFFNGHGMAFDDNNYGGGLLFYNGTDSLLLAEYTQWLPPDDAYFLSNLTTELNDALLAVYVACHSAHTSWEAGNLVSMSADKGVDNVIGFTSGIYAGHSDYWANRFWTRCINGSPLGYHQKINDAAQGAKTDVLIQYQSYGGVDSLYGLYRNYYGIPLDYLDPDRYGVI
jgi:hypothetical protein